MSSLKGVKRQVVHQYPKNKQKKDELENSPSLLTPTIIRNFLNFIFDGNGRFLSMNDHKKLGMGTKVRNV